MNPNLLAFGKSLTLEAFPYYHIEVTCGSNSVVESLPSKQVVGGSNPLSRSSFLYLKSPLVMNQRAFILTLDTNSLGTLGTVILFCVCALMEKQQTVLATATLG